ncbi:hypothetical protein BE08_19930 [Sorangium cellulosum]|uniref:Uncharacterized protein n=1 Tax=Sorangium cellulosum TaxID=56 RepID=A0A150P047_SORCE|nr:hypothetical protein BE08_19930 [Sorangium cellulosum]
MYRLTARDLTARDTSLRADSPDACSSARGAFSGSIVGSASLALFRSFTLEFLVHTGDNTCVCRMHTAFPFMQYRSTSVSGALAGSRISEA